MKAGVGEDDWTNGRMDEPAGARSASSRRERTEPVGDAKRHNSRRECSVAAPLLTNEASHGRMDE